MTPKQTKYDKSGAYVVEALKKRYFDAYYCSTKEQAVEQLLTLIPNSDVVSWGGSESLQTLGILERLKKDGYSVIDRDTAASPEEREKLMRSALTCDTFITSSNALTQDGQLFNIDGNGNRVAAMIYGPKSVVVIAGMNKVVKTIDDAISRVRNIAAPMNAQRFEGIKTPCAKTGQCSDCTSPDCICAYLVTTRISRPAGKIKVILVGEDFGM